MCLDRLCWLFFCIHQIIYFLCLYRLIWLFFCIEQIACLLFYILTWTVTLLCIFKTFYSYSFMPFSETYIQAILLCIFEITASSYSGYTNWTSKVSWSHTCHGHKFTVWLCCVKPVFNVSFNIPWLPHKLINYKTITKPDLFSVAVSCSLFSRSWLH